MSIAASELGRLWGPPGRAAAGTRGLLTRAAAAHAQLLRQAAACPELKQSLEPLLSFLQGPERSSVKRRLLCHPLFIEGLHDLAPLVSEVRQWHEAVTAGADGCSTDDEVSLASLGHTALAVGLRAPATRKEWTCRTDVIGQVGFPFSDWSLKLRTAEGEFLGRRCITIAVHHEQATCFLRGDSVPFLVLPREDLVRLVVENGMPSSQARLAYPNPRVRPQLQRAIVLGSSGVRFEPTACEPRSAHSGFTGGLALGVIAAMRRHSLGIYREFCQFMHSIRGFEAATTERGTVGSFSDPTLPGVMGINVTYTAGDEPCLDPFCFTWFGHEMGHTKNYLVDTILFTEGETLLTNASEQTGVIPRYGRSFSVRTLFQIPYVHLYEWVLLMDFYEGTFKGLPWDVPASTEEIGRDLAAEIDEAFALIITKARLTRMGTAAMKYFRELNRENVYRWRSLGFAAPKRG